MIGRMPAPVAITREVSPDFAACQLTHQSRVPIDIALARAQHQAYEEALRDAGCLVERLPAGADMPDSVFVEDTAVVLDEMGVITRPGAESRRPEVGEVARALGRYRRLACIEAPGTIDGGDALVAGRQIFIGRSTRTNDESIAALRLLLAPFGYAVIDVAVRGCLHLKSAVTLIGERHLLVNPGWIAPSAFSGFTCLAVDPGEPAAANALRLGDRIIYPSAFPRTAERLRACGLYVKTVEVSELAKAEGAVTCCSLIVQS
jgi:dimethylargininase